MTGAAGDAALRAEQRRVALGMIAGALVSLAALAWGAGAAAAPATALSERLAAAFRADLAVWFWLAAAIANVARLRFFSARDIGGSANGKASPAVAAARAVLQNTLEQACLAAGVHAALAVSLPNPAPLVMLLAALFGAGRLCFWIGYAKGAAGRAFGFALTFYPTVGGMIVAAAWNLFGR